MEQTATLRRGNAIAKCVQGAARQLLGDNRPGSCLIHCTFYYNCTWFWHGNSNSNLKYPYPRYLIWKKQHRSPRQFYLFAPFFVRYPTHRPAFSRCCGFSGRVFNPFRYQLPDKWWATWRVVGLLITMSLATLSGAVITICCSCCCRITASAWGCSRKAPAHAMGSV